MHTHRHGHTHRRTHAPAHTQTHRHTERGMLIQGWYHAPARPHSTRAAEKAQSNIELSRSVCSFVKRTQSFVRRIFHVRVVPQEGAEADKLELRRVRMT
eukprot:5112960-Pleurochrysis_carterae.AAC.1